jgi:hypothetical protein
VSDHYCGGCGEVTYGCLREAADDLVFEVSNYGCYTQGGPFEEKVVEVADPDRWVTDFIRKRKWRCELLRQYQSDKEERDHFEYMSTKDD